MHIIRFSILFVCFAFCNLQSHESKEAVVPPVRKEVTRVNRDSESGNIIGIGGDGWYETSEEAIRNIEQNKSEYYVRSKTPVHVIKDDNKKYLRTDPDETQENNLEHLPSLDSP